MDEQLHNQIQTIIEDQGAEKAYGFALQVTKIELARMLLPAATLSELCRQVAAHDPNLAREIIAQVDQFAQIGVKAVDNLATLQAATEAKYETVKH